jgi:hypothetical protein
MQYTVHAGPYKSPPHPFGVEKPLTSIRKGRGASAVETRLRTQIAIVLSMRRLPICGVLTVVAGG